MESNNSNNNNNNNSGSSREESKRVKGIQQDQDQDRKLEVSKIARLPCRRPAFRNQTVITRPTALKLDDEENMILFYKDVLDEKAVAAYLSDAVKVPRTSGRSGYGMKPRKEICYSPDGSPFVYSRIAHTTVKYPDHVLRVEQTIAAMVNASLESKGIRNPYTCLSSGIDIIYDDSFPLGGSVSAHKDDDEEGWGMIVIYSLGQTRYLRVRRDDKNDKAWYNVEMTHNSVVVMFGPTFQILYTHQVDKLHHSDTVGARLSLNIRYKKEHDEEEKEGEEEEEEEEKKK